MAHRRQGMSRKTRAGMRAGKPQGFGRPDLPTLRKGDTPAPQPGEETQHALEQDRQQREAAQHQRRQDELAWTPTPQEEGTLWIGGTGEQQGRYVDKDTMRTIRTADTEGSEGQYEDAHEAADYIKPIGKTAKRIPPDAKRVGAARVIVGEFGSSAEPSMNRQMGQNSEIRSRQTADRKEADKIARREGARMKDRPVDLRDLERDALAAPELTTEEQQVIRWNTELALPIQYHEAPTRMERDEESSEVWSAADVLEHPRGLAAFRLQDIYTAENLEKARPNTIRDLKAPLSLLANDEYMNARVVDLLRAVYEVVQNNDSEVPDLYFAEDIPQTESDGKAGIYTKWIMRLMLAQSHKFYFMRRGSASREQLNRYLSDALRRALNVFEEAVNNGRSSRVGPAAQLMDRFDDVRHRLQNDPDAIRDPKEDDKAA